MIKLILIFFLYCPLLFAQPVYQAHTKVDLISEETQARPGETLWVGVHMVMDDEWHVYWQNPGDSGLAPKIKWDLPAAIIPGEIQWPYPHRIDVGPLSVYGYEHEVLFMVPLKVSPSFDSSQAVSLKARVDWLACKVECIPGRADFVLELPASSHKELFDQTRKLLPMPAKDLTVKVFDEGQAWRLVFEGQSSQKIEFFPFRDDVIDHADKQVVSKTEEGVALTVKKSNLLNKPLSELSGIAVDPIKAKAIEITGKIVPSANTDLPSLSFFTACFFALLGGLILNLMPCVLPVLSLKILNLLKHKDTPGRALAHGGMFALGVMVSFWALAAVLIALKAAGSQVGWGFQFQSPAFVFAMAVIMFLFGLNLLGVFEIVFAFSVKRHAQSASLVNDFGAGVLITVLATPCTAPFMGTALTFALSQPIGIGLAVFTCLGLGMALPYLLLCVFPKALVFVPKPGPWMDTLKSLFGFVLLAFAVWLVWVYGLQKGADGVMILLASLWAIGLTAWLWGRGLRLWAAVILVLAGMAVFVMRPSSNGIEWQKFDAHAVEAVLKKGQPVFIDFTAAWCLTCQVNDRTVLQAKDVVEVFRLKNVAAFKADWTDYDAQITGALQSYGRNSVPVYVYYAPGSTKPVLLSEVITRDYIKKSISNNGG